MILDLNFILGLLMGLTSIILTIRFRSFKRINIYFQSEWKIDESVSSTPNLIIKVDERRYYGLRTHNLYLWNSGNETIRMDDFAEEKGCSVRLLDSSRIENARLTRSSPTFSATVRVTDHKADLEFNYLEPGEGLVLQLDEFITEVKSYSDPIFSGYLVGGKPILGDIEPITFFARAKFQMRRVSLELLTIIIILGFIFYVTGQSFDDFTSEGARGRILIATAGGFVLGSILRACVHSVKDGRYQVPKSLSRLYKGAIT